ncbi:hypothetical protein AtEden1_Chr4g0314411 [Arabidopsis thaliana]
MQFNENKINEDVIGLWFLIRFFWPFSKTFFKWFSMVLGDVAALLDSTCDEIV